MKKQAENPSQELLRSGVVTVTTKEEMKMVEQIVANIMDAIEEAKKVKPSREVSLVITKLEEALHWWSAHQRAKNAEFTAKAAQPSAS